MEKKKKKKNKLARGLNVYRWPSHPNIIAGGGSVIIHS
jgi:hypothetical protein